MNLNWLRNFPLHPATVITALSVFLSMSIVVIIRLAAGLAFPAGYENWMWVVVSAMGVTTVAGIGQRLTDYKYVQIKAQQAPPVISGGPTTVKVDSTPEVKPDV